MGEKKQAPTSEKKQRPVRRVVKIELNRNAVAAVALIGIYAVIILGVALGQPETVKPLVNLIGQMIEAIKPNIDAIVTGGATAGGVGLGIRHIVKNSGGGKGPAGSS